ncbi:MAG: hypothetical protein FWD01_03220 [Defluviitaleaceae bacterium]|nr:hypothetical protein [Defluviitaleaceae bacterium]
MTNITGITSIDITKIINKSDLGEPYDRLSDFLELEDFVKVEKLFCGKQLKFKPKHKCGDIKTEYPELVLMLGIVKAEKFIIALGGMRVYFPKLRNSASKSIKAKIAKEFNGYNYARLAEKYGYTERHIRRILVETRKRRKNPLQRL